MQFQEGERTHAHDTGWSAVAEEDEGLDDSKQKDEGVCEGDGGRRPVARDDWRGRDGPGAGWTLSAKGFHSMINEEGLRFKK